MISSAPGAGLRPILCAQQRAQREPLTREIGAALMRQDERIDLTTSTIIFSIVDWRVHMIVARGPRARCGVIGACNHTKTGKLSRESRHRAA